MHRLTFSNHLFLLAFCFNEFWTLCAQFEHNNLLNGIRKIAFYDSTANFNILSVNVNTRQNGRLYLAFLASKHFQLKTYKTFSSYFCTNCNILERKKVQAEFCVYEKIEKTDQNY